MRKTRIIYSDNGTLNDWTTSINNYYSSSQTFSFVAAEDYIYIGNIAPFNHFYVKMTTANTSNANIEIEYYTGQSWQSAVEVIDETNGLNQSGFITFVPDKSQGWVEQDTSGTGGTITELSSIEIYDKYWLRFKLDSDSAANIVMSWIGQIFSNDDELATEYPDLVRSNVLTAFESGKTDWEEQHVRAAEIIVSDLIRKKVIYSKGQILERETLTLASIKKVAEIIFNSFGDDYNDDKQRAMLEYQKRIDKSIYDIDMDRDGRLDEYEQRTRQGFMSR